MKDIGLYMGISAALVERTVAAGVSSMWQYGTRWLISKLWCVIYLLLSVLEDILCLFGVFSFLKSQLFSFKK